MHARSTYRAALAGIAVVAVAIGVGSATVQTARAAEPYQPYGGCDESIQSAQTYTSPGARACRDHGWTITRNVVVDPNGWVRAFKHLPACTVEDGSAGPLPCRWNFGPGTQGNGVGAAYFIGRDHVSHYVQGVA